MTDAPGRIWAVPPIGGTYADGLLMASTDDLSGRDYPQYTRTDLIPAMLAEAEQRGREEEREACAVVADRFQQLSGTIGAALDNNRAGRIAAAIRAREVM